MPAQNQPASVRPLSFAPRPVALSATLAVNEAIARKRRAGERVLPSASGRPGSRYIRR